LEALGSDPEFSATTVREWIGHHIEHLTGLHKSTQYDYRSYLKNDICEPLGDLPLAALSREAVAKWMQRLFEMGSSGKTIANKHGFLSGALNAAVRSGRTASNPAAGQRLSTSERQEMVCLSYDDFARLLANFTEFWRPLVEFLVAPGCRWGEATSLKPSDVDRTNNTVRVGVV
jgi:integrase